MALTLRSASRTSQRSRQNLTLILPLLLLVVFRVLTREPPAIGWRMAVSATLGVLLLVGGLTLRVLARQWKAEHAHEGLVTDGLYGYLRHPLYVGSFLLGLGLTLILGDWLLILAFLALFTVNHGMVVKSEERELEAAFGAAYDRYRAEVPPLLPRLTVVRREVLPRNGRQAVIRECDAICLWLGLPLLAQLLAWVIAHPETPAPSGLALVMLAGVAALALLWARWKPEYRALIRRERLTRIGRP
jgi:protein-S-isoprenylcysteine O-methyltransferase Ste14